jgi:hypothetical protein
MVLDRESGYQKIREQETRVSGYQENRTQEIFNPDAPMSLPAAGRLISTT